MISYILLSPFYIDNNKNFLKFSVDPVLLFLKVLLVCKSPAMFQVAVSF